MNTRINVKNNEELSILGLGCMRLPMKGNQIDEERAIKLIHEAYRNGVNYFDTAYPYHGGKSEPLLGKALKQGGFRENIYVATKMPQFMVRSLEQAKKIFDSQLERLQTDYIDYYLMHMFTDLASFERMKNMGVIAFLEQKKEDGIIKSFGFSFHGGKEDFIQILKAYPWDFCQIQYNYMDEFTQATVDGLRLAYEMQIPVIIMEPLRGGRLVNNLPKEVQNAFAAADKNRSFAEWALRWIWNHKEVNVVLSGMSTEEQLEENIKIAADAEPGHLTQEELNVFDQIKSIMMAKTKVPCTGCNYCMPCHKGVDIPGVFSFYNEKSLMGPKGVSRNYLMFLGLGNQETHYANQCIGCGLCEKHCPQKIKISEEMKHAKKDLEPFWFRPVVSVGRGAVRIFRK
ncbi:MAG: aldo/keto reductase [Lachnospiraceae bacterium]